jgi:predicted DNA-binding protein
MSENPERKQTSWRIPVSLRKRLTSWAEGEGRDTEKVVAEWLEEKLSKEERKKAAEILRRR